jgi:chromosome segregation protein
VFLKSLTLKGFKSFADTATLEFEPGVTVVVGPNGSGKSNIVDAVAWVLGAQAARALRSAKMEDVVFAGTSKRAGLGRAEVSLVIDNSAGLLPIDFSEVRITRSLWRSGESEYSINGAPCRLLDIQELLSDTGVGRQQHTIISQSQLDTILSARAEDRRAVIEEAAGISKHRRRKEKAERRLEATEGSLLRAQDLLKEVRRQLRPLERQAEAARRHADVMGELTALRRYLHGREAGVLSSRLAAVTGSKAELARSEEAVLATLSRLEASVATAEASVDAGRERAETTDLAELVSSAEGLRSRASGLVALVHERARGIQRDRAATVDKDVVSSLEAESAGLSSQLAETERDAEQLLPLEAELAVAEEGLAREAAELEATFGDAARPAAGAARQAGARPDGGASGRRAPDGGARPVPPAQRAGEVRAELSALRRAVAQAETELRRAADRSGAVEGRLSRLQEEVKRSEAAQRSAEAGAGALAEAVEHASQRLLAAEADLATAEESRRSADAARHRWSARAEALGQALDEARARAGARRLARVEGMLGALVELVDVDEGLEAAFEAAAGEALSAVLMASEEAARKGLAHLAGQKAPGAVIAVVPGARGATVDLVSGGALDLDALSGPGGLPDGAGWLRLGVRPHHPAVTGLLDRLLANAVVVDGDWSAAVDVAVARPELVVVTRAGDRCAGGIWRTGSHGTGATGAALEEACAAVRAATADAEEASGVERQAKVAMEQARSAGSAARRSVADNTAALRAAREALGRARSDMAEAAAEAATLVDQRQELVRSRDRDVAAMGDLEVLLPELEAAAEEERRQAAAAAEEESRRIAAERAARARLAEHGAAVATLRRDLEVRATGIEERRALLGRRLAEVERRLAGSVVEREEAARRRARLDEKARAVGRLRSFVQERLGNLEQVLERLRELRRSESEALRGATESLEALRRERAGVERQLSVAREQSSRAGLEEAELKGRLEALIEAVRRELDCELESLEGAECPELPPGTSAHNRARELERELRVMGPVNPLALEEYAALEERHKFLQGQLHDISAARKELTKVIKAVDAEIIVVFKAAYDDVADNFTKLVATLFPGGSGSLSLCEPSNVLGSGVELEVRPVGKNVRRLSLLSGGERSLVALAFLFAVFRSRPSPFYMMDEVESALDDINLHRFLDLVNEFRDEAQLLIVSHQKRTMEAADCLYGVSMPPGGSSIVVSEKVERSPRSPAVVLSGAP